MPSSGLPSAPELLLDLDAVRIVRARLPQGDEVQHHQQQQRERHRHDVQREEAVQRGIGDAVVAADPLDQRRHRCRESCRTG